MYERNNSYAYSDPSGFCVVAGPTEVTSGGRQETISGIGCVDAKPVPPSQQLMSDGRSIAEHVAAQRAFTGALEEALSWATPGGGEVHGLAMGINLFRAAGVHYTPHFAKRLAQRIAQGRVTAAQAYRALKKGVPYWDPKYGTYMLRDARSGVAVAADTLDRDAATLDTVFDGKNPSPRWVPLPWVGR
jgi:hypothetical protein